MSISEPEPSIEWPADVLEARLPTLAAVVENLIADERRWVHRRVDTITLLDEQMVRRSSSVDFTLPVLAEEPAHGTHLVPITMLKKDVLRRLDVADERGGSLPVLTKQQNGPIAAQVLVGQATSLLGPDDPLTEPLRNQLRYLCDGVERDPLWASDTERPTYERQAKRLADDPNFLGLVDDFARQFLLIVPLRTQQGERRVVKFAYDSRLGRGLRRGEGESWLSYRLRLFRHRLGDLADVVGLDAFTVSFETPALFDAESYHVEVEASDELIIASARLYRRMPDSEPGESDAGANAPPTERWKLVDRDDNVGRAHLYSNEEPPVGVSEAIVVADFLIRPRVIWPALLFTGLTAATFAIALMLHFVWEISRSESAPTPLLVALPALFAPMAAPGAHALTRRMFKGLRALVLACALSLLAGAATLVVELSQRTVEWSWFVLGSVCAGAMALTLVSFIKASRHTRAVSSARYDSI